MSKLKRAFMRYFILSKRLLKKAGFIVILLLVPILVGAMSIAAGNGDSGVITVALAMQDKNDKIACEIVDGLTEKDSLIRFELCESPSDASALVENGNADAAWIFASDLEEKIQKFANHTHKNNAFVVVIQREESVFLRLSHEKLNAALYPYISLATYREAMSNNIVTSELSEEELDEFYRAVNAAGADLFEFAFLSDETDAEQVVDVGKTSFLLSPMRGILALMVLLCGVAVAMFYMQDEARGAFDRLPLGTGFSFSVTYHISAVVMVGGVVFAALALTGIAANLIYELLILTIYCATVVGFCMCLRMALRDIRLFGAIAPLLIVITAVLCPIFIIAPNLPIIQYLLPTYYYVRAFSNSNFVLYMAIYCVVLYLLAFGLHSMRLKQKK